MEDAEIVALYLRRDEGAIAATAEKYGALCRSIARNILTVEEDAEECVSDAYLQAWNAIPPQEPENLAAWMGRVVRNLALNLWKKNRRQKRYGGLEVLLQELEDCVPAPGGVEQGLEARELARQLNGWLAALPKEDRVLFVRRYWYGEAVNQLARQAGVSSAHMAKRMYRLRQGLRAALEKEGYAL